MDTLKHLTKNMSDADHCFLKNFKKKVIIETEYLAAVILYIHLNPVKHGFTLNPQDWKWTSYHNFHLERLSVLNPLYGNEEKYFQAHEGKIKSFAEHDKLENYFLN